MRPYQEEYLTLLAGMARQGDLTVDQEGPEAFMETVRQSSRAAREAVERGTQLLRENLFPMLDDILSASREELEDLQQFAGELMAGTDQKDVGLHYRIHQALTDYARHGKHRDMLIRELYLVGMSLYNMETNLSPNKLRLYAARMRMSFVESAGYFETDYDDITDPEIRGYIHRSMGNIALGYEGNEAAKLKLAAIQRSLGILTDPDIQAKTPSLPWDRYIYMSHQERTTMLSYLRSGHAEPEVFAQVLESTQIIQERQLRQARERGEPLQPRWQYAYYAARYHCGAMLLTEFLDTLYALSTARPDDDFGPQGMFCHVSVPALYMEYCKKLPAAQQPRHAGRVDRMLRRMCRWLVRAPNSDSNALMMFYTRQVLYAYLELPGCMTFFDVMQNVFAARHPTSYAKMWRAGRTAETLCRWATEDCPEKLVGLLDCADADQVVRRKEELARFAERAGRLYDAGMIHCFDMVLLPCRGLFEEEHALLQLHTYCGAQILGEHPSTAMYADIAHGHHCYFNEKGGYPMGFSPRSSPVRAMIHIISVADALTAGTDHVGDHYRPAKSFETILGELKEGAGSRYAPFVVSLLESPQRQKELKDSMEQWILEAYQALYRRRSELANMV